MTRRTSKQEKGITLVALIITIIVILILVGVTIGQIAGSDGIIKRAQNSTAEYKQKSAEEKVALLMQEYQYDKMEKGLKGEEYTLKQFLDDNTGKYDKYDLDSNPKTITIDNIDVAIDDNYSVIDNTKKADASDPLKNTDRTVDDLEKDNGDSNKDGKVDTNDDLRGFYIDLNNDGVLTTTDDGVIFGDQKTGGEGLYFCHTLEDIDTISEEQRAKFIQQMNDYCKYKIPTKSTLSTYEIIKDSNGNIKKFDGPFGIRGMLQRQTAVTDGNRFYVMALADIDNNRYTWYKNASGKMNDYATYTSTAFGSGKTNTEKMIARGNAGGTDANDTTNSNYGALSDTDVWKVIKTQADNGWFVPSRDEWNAFGAFFKVGGDESKIGIFDGKEHTFTDYYDYNTVYKLSNWCWASSQDSTDRAYRVGFLGGGSGLNGVDFDDSVRLGSTF